MKRINLNRYKVSGLRSSEVYERIMPATSEQNAILKVSEFEPNINWDKAVLISKTRRRLL